MADSFSIANWDKSAARYELQEIPIRIQRSMYSWNDLIRWELRRQRERMLWAVYWSETGKHWITLYGNPYRIKRPSYQNNGKLSADRDRGTSSSDSDFSEKKEEIDTINRYNKSVWFYFISLFSIIGWTGSARSRGAVKSDSGTHTRYLVGLFWWCWNWMAWYWINWGE